MAFLFSTFLIYALIILSLIPILVFLISFVCYKYTMPDHVDAVALKLPQFWANLPAHWFLHIESQFRTKNIVVEKTKYDYVIASLSQEIIASVFDVVSEISSSQEGNEPIQDPYTVLKKHLIERHTLSESSRIETLLSGLEIGDRKPSEFFRALKTLAGTSDVVNDKLILNLWTRRLPTMVQATLKALPKAEVADQLTMADNIYEIYIQNDHAKSSIHAVTNLEPSHNTLSNVIAQNKRLEKEISDIRRMISRLSDNTMNSNRNSRSNNRNFNRDRSQSRKRNANQTNVCWYHAKYADKASKCKQPCSFESNPN